MYISEISQVKNHKKQMTWKLEHNEEEAIHSDNGSTPLRDEEDPALRWDGCLQRAGSRQRQDWTSSRSQIIEGLAGLANELKLHLVNDKESWAMFTLERR